MEKVMTPQEKASLTEPSRNGQPKKNGYIPQISQTCRTPRKENGTANIGKHRCVLVCRLVDHQPDGPQRLRHTYVICIFRRLTQ